MTAFELLTLARHRLRRYERRGPIYRYRGWAGIDCRGYATTEVSGAGEIVSPSSLDAASFTLCGALMSAANVHVDDEGCFAGDEAALDAFTAAAAALAEVIRRDSDFELDELVIDDADGDDDDAAIDAGEQRLSPLSRSDAVARIETWLAHAIVEAAP